MELVTGVLITGLRCGDIYEDPTLLFPGVADRRYLEPMYDRVNQEIRKYDEEHIILFEGVSWEVTGIGEALGFTHPPGGFDYSNRWRVKGRAETDEKITAGQSSPSITQSRRRSPPTSSSSSTSGRRSSDSAWPAS